MSYIFIRHFQIITEILFIYLFAFAYVTRTRSYRFEEVKRAVQIQYMYASFRQRKSIYGIERRLGFIWSSSVDKLIEFATGMGMHLMNLIVISENNLLELIKSDPRKS